MGFVGVIAMDLVRVVEIRYAEVRKKVWAVLLDLGLEVIYGANGSAALLKMTTRRQC